MKRVLAPALLTLALGAGVAPAYSVSDPQPVTPFVPGINESSTLTQAWQRWQGKEIDNYVIKVRRSCFCAPTPAIRTVIRDNTTRRVTRGDKRLRRARGYSMDELFIMIREASATADHVEVTYTPRGIPTSIAIDPDEQMADEETYYKVKVARLR